MRNEGVRESSGNLLHQHGEDLSITLADEALGIKRIESASGLSIESIVYLSLQCSKLEHFVLDLER